MKILVTGGAGFVGSHIVDSLIALGNEVVIIDNLSSGKKENINSEAIFYNEDILSEDILEKIFALERPSIVIHTAAQVLLRESLKNPAFDAKTNVLGTINVLEACVKHKAKKIIYTSTGGARVGNPEYLPVDEKHPINPTSPYGISKHTAEHYVWLYNYLYGLDYQIFCFGNVYGPRDDPKSQRVISLFISKMLNNELPVIYGDGKQTRDFIYVKDLAEFITHNIEKQTVSKLFHLANGSQISINYIYALLKNELNFDREPNYVDSIKGEVKDILLDTSLARRELDWRPKRSFEEGVKETINYFKKTNNL